MALVLTMASAIAIRKVGLQAQDPPLQSMFPLSVSANQRYLVDGNGDAFFIHGDTPWSMAAQLTNAQIDTYLNDRQSKGFTAIMFNAPEKYFTSQSPSYNNASGNQPFTTTSHTAASFQSLVEAYWTRVDYIVNQALALGIVCIIQPAYLGFGGGSGSSGDQGWDFQVNAATAGNLQTYGATLASRYTQGNVIWCMGGDYVPPDVTKQWNIVTGIRSVDPNAIVTAHGSRSSAEAYPDWSGQTGFNLNTIYSDGVEYDLAATAYARNFPFFLIEGYYDGETATVADCRRQAYASVLSGACGHMFGNNPIWGFGEPNANGGAGAAAALSGSLNTTATQHMAHVKSLFSAYQWHLLAPSTGTALVTSALGTGTARVCPALASDGSFAMVWVPSSQSVTINKAALAPSLIRIRLYDTTAGTFSTHTASTANTGTISVATGGERVVVLDAA